MDTLLPFGDCIGILPSSCTPWDLRALHEDDGEEQVKGEEKGEDAVGNDKEEEK